MFSKMLVVFALLVACWNSWSIDAAVVPAGPLRSYITGGFKGVQPRNQRSSLDCTQYANDFEILYYFPFSVMINPMVHQWEKSVAQMDPSDTFVTQLNLRDYNSTIPESIFCLKRLTYLDIDTMKFINDVVPDSLGNLKRLSSLTIRNTPITSMTSQLTSLHALYSLNIYRSSLTHLPDLSEMENLQSIYLQNNHLTELIGLNSPHVLALEYNNFTALPVTASPSSLSHLYMNGNPLKHVLPISSFVNVHYLGLSYTPIAFIPPTIDKLQSLSFLDLANTKITYLPKNILKLHQLQNLYLQGNNLGTNEISTIQQEFNKTLPNCKLYF